MQGMRAWLAGLGPRRFSPLSPLWIAPAVLAAALVVAWLDDDAGLPAWARLRSDLREAEARIEALRAEIHTLEASSEALASDSFAQEAAIRADLGLARPGETVIRLVPRTRDELPRP